MNHNVQQKSHHRTKHINLERDEKQTGIKSYKKLEQTEETETESGMSMLVKKRDIKATETDNVSSEINT